MNPTDLMGGLGSTIDNLFIQMGWAEDEIEQAQKRHPDAADAVWDTFKVCCPTHERMATELVYRSHVRELCERVAAGQDTRPGTDAEIACLLNDMSLRTPLNTPATGLYLRVFSRAFPDTSAVPADELEHYEAIASGQMDDFEAEARKKLTDNERVLDVKQARKAA